jgi:exosortase E/protease (VPEID-CTERM system)
MGILGRRIGVAALLPLEILLLTLSFESQRLGPATPWAAAMLEHASVLPRISIAVAGTLALLLSPRMATLRTQFGSDPRPYPWEWIALHLLCFAGLFEYTREIFASRPGYPSPWSIAAWMVACALVAVTWCIALAPADAWRRFLADERRAVGAALVIGIVVWGFGVATRVIWRPLAEATLFLAQGLLRAVYDNVEYDPVAGTVGTHKILIEIAPQCSGYEGLALMAVFATLYLWLFRERLSFPRALWLLPVGLVAIWLANVVRIAALVMVGTSISPQVAVQGFHSQAGWIAFTAIGLALIAVAHRSGWVAKAPHDRADGSPLLAAALIVPFLALIATSMVAAAFSSGFEALYPLGVLATVAALAHYRSAYRRFEFDFSPAPVLIGFLVFAMWIALDASYSGSGGATRTMPDLAPGLLAAWLAFRVVGTVITVPIAEELAFRGYLLRKLVASDFESVPPTRFTWLSFLGSSVLFGLMHQSWLAGTLAGAGFAWAVYRRGRVTDAIVAHMTANALIVATAFTFGRWDLWL